MARNKSEKERRTERSLMTGGDLILRGGTALSTMGRAFPWEEQPSEMVMKSSTLAALKGRYKNVQASINELQKAGIVRTTKSGAVYVAEKHV